MQSTLLPHRAREMLATASRTKDPRARQIAIEQATAKIRLLWPEFFRVDVERAE